MRRAYQRPVAEVLAALGVDPARGLDPAEARARFERYGRNELPEAPPPPLWLRFLAQFRDPLTGLLLAATLISFAVWLIERADPLPFEALTILAIVLLNGVLGFVQESRAEQAVAALRVLAAPQARVLRGGRPQTIPAAEVVPGDILLIEEGDTVPADARIIESIALRVAEAVLTGESASVSKDSDPIKAEVTLPDRHNMLFSGTAVASGRGRAVVTATGQHTEIGKIAGTLQHTESEPTPLQNELARVGRFLGAAVIAIAVVMSVTLILVSGARRLGDLVDVLILGVSLAVAAVPEGLTAITTIVLSLGMQRMAGRNVIVRRLASVETLGSTTVICTDKTGTLTRNEMTVRAVVTPSGRVSLDAEGEGTGGTLNIDGRPMSDPALREEVRKALRAAHMANNARLVQENGRLVIRGDPTEGALLLAARRVGLTDDELDERFPRVGEVPFTSERKLMSTAHVDQEKERLIVFTKGAPDILLARCDYERVGLEGEVRSLTAERRREILACIEELADQALRTLGVAYRTLARDAASGQFSEDVERSLVFLGVLGLIDPLRPEARQSVAQAKRAGIRPIMITGDHPRTAAAIAAEAGIGAPGQSAMTGSALQQMDDAELRRVLGACSVFARVAPEHKLRLVRALKADGAIVAMTGDGVNDAPALKAADIGVAMGITGTDVSKGAADMILTDDNFASIVAAVEEGRSIFANIQKFLRYLLSSNIGEVLTMFGGVTLASVIGLTHGEGTLLVAPLLATQILWINLLTDAAPALALGLEPADPQVMERPPRDPRTPVITRQMWFNIFFAGLIMAVGTLAVMDAALPGGLIAGTGDLAYAQTMSFTTLVLFQLFNVLNARSDERSAFYRFFGNPWLWGAVGLSFVLQALVVYLPALQRPFNTVPLSLNDWVVCVGVASSVLWLGEARKLIARLRRQG
ncbi:MAG: cation-translocating P-type ATPase [Oscillochloridaceae bacterium]|nr:cation-translocating P-type ATPase [Chloroflexaceae bacterium]MDW8390898.1 cation-translocating P-type ATPase [Oscillochloridaceae bacterium]